MRLIFPQLSICLKSFSDALRADVEDIEAVNSTCDLGSHSPLQ